MRGIYLYYNDIDLENLSGIDKKILWQIDELNKNRIDCELVVIEKDIKNIIDKILLRVPFSNKSPKWEYIPEFDRVNFIYLRRPPAITSKMIKIFKKVKSKNPNLKIILEIPTYPYDDELKMQLIDYPILLKDLYNRKKLKYVIDRIAVQNKIEEIFGIPTLQFSNGIKIDNIEIKETIEDKESIDICAVANMHPWQGYERIIKSLNNYYNGGKRKNINIHFVGEGKEISYYKKLVRLYSLEKYIKFHGFLTGGKLEKIYNQSDLALDAFGRYKTNNPISTSLKSREYLAKGLPVVSGSNSDLFDSTNEFYLEFSNDESLFDFGKIVEFYNDIYKDKSKLEVAKTIRKYAYKVCDISKTMTNVTNYIKETF